MRCGLLCCYKPCRLCHHGCFTAHGISGYRGFLLYTVLWFHLGDWLCFWKGAFLILLSFSALFRLRTYLQRITKLSGFYKTCFKNCVSICWNTYASMSNLILLLEIKFTKAIRPQYLLWFTVPDFNISFTSILPFKWVPGSNVLTRSDLTLM